jgi:hypothetical protein
VIEWRQGYGVINTRYGGTYACKLGGWGLVCSAVLAELTVGLAMFDMHCQRRWTYYAVVCMPHVACCSSDPAGKAKRVLSPQVACHACQSSRSNSPSAACHTVFLRVAGSLLLPLQSLVDLPPEVARVANQAAATGGQVLGEWPELLAWFHNTSSYCQTSNHLLAHFLTLQAAERHALVYSTA